MYVHSIPQLSQPTPTTHDRTQSDQHGFSHKTCENGEKLPSSFQSCNAAAVHRKKAREVVESATATAARPAAKLGTLWLLDLAACVRADTSAGLHALRLRRPARAALLLLQGARDLTHVDELVLRQPREMLAGGAQELRRVGRGCLHHAEPRRFAHPQRDAGEQNGVGPREVEADLRARRDERCVEGG